LIRIWFLLLLLMMLYLTKRYFWIDWQIWVVSFHSHLTSLRNVSNLFVVQPEKLSKKKQKRNRIDFYFFESFSIWPMEEPTQLCQSAIEKKTREKNAR
jgi:hypothetical protein